MPEIVTLPYTPVTGLGDLGNILLQGGAGYAQEKRRQDDETRIRANQLADIQSARSYEDTVRATQRTNMLQDEQRHIHQAIAGALVNEHLLDPNDLDKPDAVEAAFQKARDLGLEKEYQDMLSTPDLSVPPDASGTRPTLLTIADLNNPVKVAAAKQRLGQMRGQQAERTLKMQTNSQDSADHLQQQYDQTISQATQLESEMNVPIEQLVAPPSAAEVQKAAVAAAMAESGGKQPSAKDIAAQVPIVTDALQKQRLEGAMLRRQQNQERVRLLRDSANSLRSGLNALATKGIFPSDQTFNGAPAPTAPGPARNLADPNAQKNAMQSIIDAVKKTAAPAPAAVGDQLPNPTNNPLVAAENTATSAQRWQSSLADPYNQALDELAATQAQIRELSQPPQSAGSMTFDPTTPEGSSTYMASQNPSVRARQLSDLLQKEQALKQQVDAKKRAMLQLDPSQVMANPMAGGPPVPAVSTPSASIPSVGFPSVSAAPQWWNAPQPGVPAMMY